ncbi:MAG TPA: hypothetical protein VGM92_11720 [Candidatus Kapabacteria bacterium]
MPMIRSAAGTSIFSVLTEEEIPLRLRLKIEGRMWQKIGEQKIDVVYERPGALSSFGKLAFPQAIPL